MRELVITNTAKEDLERIAVFLKSNYSERVKTDFLEAFSKRLALIEQIFTAYFYKVTDDLILILSVLDTRIDPDTIRF